MHDGDSQIPTIWGQIKCGGNNTTDNDSFVKMTRSTERRERTTAYQIVPIQS